MGWNDSGIVQLCLCVYSNLLDTEDREKERQGFSKHVDKRNKQAVCVILIAC